MPSPEPPTVQRPDGAATQPTRRAVVTAGLGTLTGSAVLWGTSGCRLRIGSPSSADQSKGEPTTPPAAAVAGPAELATAAQTALALQVAYGQAIAVRPDLTAALTRLSADHTAHLRALAALGITAPAGSSTDTETASPTDTTTPTPTTPTGTVSPAASPTATTALSLLAQLERSGASSALQDIAALDGRTARLLASIGACRSSHVTLLARLPASAATATATKAGG